MSLTNAPAPTNPTGWRLQGNHSGGRIAAIREAKDGLWAVSIPNKKLGVPSVLVLNFTDEARIARTPNLLDDLPINLEDTAPMETWFQFCPDLVRAEGKRLRLMTRTEAERVYLDLAKRRGVSPERLYGEMRARVEAFDKMQAESDAEAAIAAAKRGEPVPEPERGFRASMSSRTARAYNEPGVIESQPIEANEAVSGRVMALVASCQGSGEGRGVSEAEFLNSLDELHRKAPLDEPSLNYIIAQNPTPRSKAKALKMLADLAEDQAR